MIVKQFIKDDSLWSSVALKEQYSCVPEVLAFLAIQALWLHGVQCWLFMVIDGPQRMNHTAFGDCRATISFTCMVLRKVFDGLSIEDQM